MPSDIISRDQNRVTVLAGVTDDANAFIKQLLIDPATGRLKVSATISAGAGITSINGQTDAAEILDSVDDTNVTLTISQVSTDTNRFTLGWQSQLSLARGGTGANLSDPGADRIMFWDDSAGTVTWLTVGTGLTITDTTITASGSGGTVTSVSVVSANGFAGSVADATTTPAITLTTTINAPVLAGNGTAISAATTTGSTSTVVLQTSPTLITPVLGVATATSINGLTITSSTGTFTLTNAKTLSVTNTLTLSGTDGTTMTFPTTSATLARTDAGNTFTGVSTASAWVLTSPTITTKISPTTDDGAPLGDTTHNWSDLFLASGALINFAAGDAVITHSTGVLTVSTGDLRVTTAGTNAASVVTTSGTQELDNKTLDSSVGKGTWTASGTWTLPAITLGGDATLSENVGIVLDSALSADGKYCGVVEAGTAGATLAFGDLVYLAAADSRWELADASAASTSGSVKIGMCVLAAAGDGSATTILLYGKLRADTAFPAMTISAPMYISETAGDITGTQPTTTDAVIRVVGFANTADELYFNPSFDYITHT